MTKRRQLRRRILARYGSLGEFAEDAGISRQALSGILAGRNYPSNKTMESMRALLEIRDEEIGALLYERE